MCDGDFDCDDQSDELECCELRGRGVWIKRERVEEGCK